MTATVSFSGVGKRYRRGRERVNARALIPGRLGETGGGEIQWALRDVSFELAAGHSLGVVGPNGAGKSTLLKLVAHVISPTCGEITVRGRSTSLIELGAGFHPDMTGRENVYFSAAVLGMGPRDLRRRFDQIVEFADIGSYLDTPVKRYSSGMLARLGFAVAAHLDAELIILDEVLAVGDAAFQRKCHQRIAELRRSGAALLYVTHALWTLPQLCDSAMLLVGGTVRRQGTPAEVLSAYEGAQARPDGSAGEASGVFGPITLSAAVIEPGGRLDVGIELRLAAGHPDGRVMVLVATADDTILGATASDGPGPGFPAGVTAVECRLESVPFQPGEYIVGVLFFADRAAPVFDDARQFHFEVRGPDWNPAFGSTFLSARWASAPAGSGAECPRGAESDPYGQAAQDPPGDRPPRDGQGVDAL